MQLMVAMKGLQSTINSELDRERKVTFTLSHHIGQSIKSGHGLTMTVTVARRLTKIIYGSFFFYVSLVRR
jgi:hypothetical protein